MARAKENDVPTGGDEQSLSGKVKEVTGWATGDRALEADGRAEATDEDATGTVEEQVRKEHRDIDED